ncbi:MAG: hypothetical protein IK078_06930, partial [Lachnospiraceae bacterium]|nr:hypothetical protein [Lachnospiraceae bacterium]
MSWALAVIFAVVAGVFGFLWYKQKADDAAEKKAREAEDRVKSTTKGVLDRSGVGPVLAVASDMSVLFFNRDFVEIFPDVV